jgi:hypothetical protein
MPGKMVSLPFSPKVFKEIFLPLYKSKQSPDKDNGKEEKITALTTRELCEEYKKKTGKTIRIKTKLCSEIM